MYRDDDAARAERANALIDEIAALEREKLAHATTEQRLEDARRQLATLHATLPPPPQPQRHPGVITHALVFAVTAAVAFTAYTLVV